MTDAIDSPPSEDFFARQELFPIREVARLTGINPVTLRAWERRYGLIQPTRTDSGHRLYSHADVETVRLIQAWTQRGVPVSKVGDLLARAAAAKAAPGAEPPASNADWAEWQRRVQQAACQFDEARLEQLYGQLFAVWSTAVVFQEVLMPVWQHLYVRRETFGGTSEWLFLDAFLRARVLQRLQLARPAGAARVLLAQVPGQCHELEALLAGLLLGSDDLAVGVLAAGQPLEELGLVCARARPQALLLLSHHTPSGELHRQLQRLVLSVECPVALVGEAAELGRAALAGTPVACLGRPGTVAASRLAQWLAGRLDT